MTNMTAGTFIGTFIENWDFFWQNIPIKYLLNNSLKDIFYMHSQPPLHNIFFGIIVKLFYPHHYLALQIINYILAICFIGLNFYIIKNVIKNFKLKVVLTILVCFNPSIYLYANFLLYTLNTGFLVILLLFFLVKYLKQNKNYYIYLFFFTLNILGLYRSSFHLIFILFVYLLFYYLLKKSRKYILYSLIFMLPVIFWYSKNYYTYNFFGSSSWLGLNIYKFITTDLSSADKRQIKIKTDIPDVVNDNTHFYTNFKKYRKYGFNKNSQINYLNDNNWQNCNVPDLSKVFFISALKIIKLYPKHYIRNVFVAYNIYSKPSYTFGHLRNNRKKISNWLKFYNNIFFLDNYILKKYAGLDIYPILFLIIPISILIGLFILIQKNYKIDKNKQIIISFLVLLITYYTVVSCFLEIGENNRFKFSIESLIYILFFLIIDFFVRGKKCVN